VTDPTSRQRGRPTETRQQTLDRKKYLVKRPQSGLDTMTYGLTVSRNMTLALVILTWAGQ
jgi:hypothetical protein